MAAKSNSKPAGKNTKETEKKKPASSTKSSASKGTKASAAKPNPATRAAATKDTSSKSAAVRGGASKAASKKAPAAESIPGGTSPSKSSKATKSIAPTRGSKDDGAQIGTPAAAAPSPKAAAAANAAAASTGAAPSASKKPAKPVREIYSAATGTASSSPFPTRELEKFRGLINDLRVENQDELEVLTGQLREMTSSETGDDNSAYSMHMAEQGTDAMEHEKTFLQAQRTSDYIKKLEEALDRIDNGTFGLCRVCGLRIDSKRLMAVPVTQVCTVYKNTSKPCEPGKIHMQQTGITEDDLPK